MRFDTQVQKKRAQSRHYKSGRGWDPGFPQIPDFSQILGPEASGRGIPWESWGEARNPLLGPENRFFDDFSPISDRFEASGGGVWDPLLEGFRTTF